MLNRVVGRMVFAISVCNTVCLMSPNMSATTFWHVAGNFSPKIRFFPVPAGYTRWNIGFWPGCRCPARLFRVCASCPLSHRAAASTGQGFHRVVHAVGFHALYIQVLETETANRVRSGYRYGCGNLFGQPHFVIDVSPRDIAVQFFSQVAELFILIDRQLSQSQHWFLGTIVRPLFNPYQYPFAALFGK